MTEAGSGGNGSDAQDLEQVLDAHEQWLESGGREGRRADLSGADLSGAKLDGRDLSRAYLVRASFGMAGLVGTNFSGARLHWADFTRCNFVDVRFEDAHLIGTKLNEARFFKGSLEKANLSRAELRGSRLEEANLRRAQLPDAELEGADLTRAVLTEADLTGAKLAKADLRGATLSHARLLGASLPHATLIGAKGVDAADLRYADLAETIGLHADQLARRDLTGARFHGDIGGFHTLPIIEETSKNARRIFFSMLLGCAYSWLTLSTTSDARLLTNSASSPLPIIGTAIPIAFFFWTAPFVLVATYAYLHLYLQRLWDGLARLPAVFPDGRRIDQRVYPWLLSGLVRRHEPTQLTDRSVQARGEEVVTMLLAWWTLPATLVGFWWYYLPRHHWPGTILHVLLIALTAGTAVISYRIATRTLERGGKYSLEAAHALPGAILAVVVLLLFGALSNGSIRGIPGRDGKPRPWIVASLRDAQVSLRPPDYWSIRDPEDREKSVTGAQLRGSDLRFARGVGAFMASADLTGADLTGADLRGAILRGATLGQSVVAGTRLDGADLRDVKGLTQAQLDGASCDEKTALPDGLSKQGCGARAP